MSRSKSAQRNSVAPDQALASEDDEHIWSVFLSPDDRNLAVVTKAKPSRLAVYRLEGESLGEIYRSWSISSNSPVKWSATGELLAIIKDYKAEILHATTGEPAMVLGQANALDFSPDGSRLAVLGGRSLAILSKGEVFYNSYGREMLIPPGVTTGFTSTSVCEIAFSPDGQLLACTSETCTVLIVDTTRMKVVQELVGHSNIIIDLAWIAPDILATAARDNTIRIWRAADGDELRRLESSGSIDGICHAARHDLLAGWTYDEYFIWSTAEWDLRWQGPLPTQGGLGYRYVSASQRSTLLARLNGPSVTDITFARQWDASAGDEPGSVSTYTNAKVLLLGDTGVGKSGLALVLAGEPFRPTESTHARHIWTMPSAELGEGAATQREVLLWDLAGQPGYRIVHQLHLADAAAALILFDSRSETAPLAGIGHWARALAHAQVSAVSSRDSLPTFLVAARTDRGVVSVSNERLAELVKEFGFRGYLSTSALEGWGVDELRSAVLAAIDWARIPVVTSSVLFSAVKGFVLDQKARGTVLSPLAAPMPAAFERNV